MLGLEFQGIYIEKQSKNSTIKTKIAERAKEVGKERRKEGGGREERRKNGMNERRNGGKEGKQGNRKQCFKKLVESGSPAIST